MHPSLRLAAAEMGDDEKLFIVIIFLAMITTPLLFVVLMEEEEKEAKVVVVLLLPLLIATTAVDELPVAVLTEECIQFLMWITKCARVFEKVLLMRRGKKREKTLVFW